MLSYRQSKNKRPSRQSEHSRKTTDTLEHNIRQRDLDILQGQTQPRSSQGQDRLYHGTRDISAERQSHGSAFKSQRQARQSQLEETQDVVQNYEYQGRMEGHSQGQMKSHSQGHGQGQMKDHIQGHSQGQMQEAPSMRPEVRQGFKNEVVAVQNAGVNISLPFGSVPY